MLGYQFTNCAKLTGEAPQPDKQFLEHLHAHIFGFRTCSSVFVGFHIRSLSTDLPHPAGTDETAVWQARRPRYDHLTKRRAEHQIGPSVPAPYGIHTPGVTFPSIQ